MGKQLSSLTGPLNKEETQLLLKTAVDAVNTKVATEATLAELKAVSNNILSEIQSKDLMIVIKNLLTIITNPTWLDMATNRLNVQATLQSGTVTTVSTVTNLSNIDNYPGRMLIMTNELNAWANTVRRTIV